jgi:hypothetical protein
MDFHLERGLRLPKEPNKSWAINEIDAQGQTIGRDQMPWEWTFYFTATSCFLCDSIEIDPPFDFKFKVTNQDGTVTEQESSDKRNPRSRKANSFAHDYVRALGATREMRTTFVRLSSRCSGPTERSSI